MGLVQCESNLLGSVNNHGINVGSGGWSNIIDKYAKAKRYCDVPFEVRNTQGRKTVVPIPGEWIGERLNGARPRSVAIHCASSTALDLAPASLDAVFTDPPYFGNVQYGELMDFCYAWLRRLVGRETEGFDRESSRSPDELTGNATQGRGLDHFAEGLAAVYRAMARALKPGAPLAFTFHHHRIEAYHAVAVAILDAGLFCTAALPCPAEMGGSIHIHGTGSSIVDTVFRCIVFGYLARIAIWRLRPAWDAALPTAAKLERITEEIEAFGDPKELIDTLKNIQPALAIAAGRPNVRSASRASIRPRISSSPTNSAPESSLKGSSQNLSQIVR